MKISKIYNKYIIKVISFLMIFFITVPTVFVINPFDFGKISEVEASAGSAVLNVSTSGLTQKGWTAFTIANDGFYQIDVTGGQGGESNTGTRSGLSGAVITQQGGYGGKASGCFYLKKGTYYYCFYNDANNQSNSLRKSYGGLGAFISDNATFNDGNVLICAGGGGGGGYQAVGGDATTAVNGNYNTGSMQGGARYANGGAGWRGGKSGNGGTDTTSYPTSGKKVQGWILPCGMPPALKGQFAAKIAGVDYSSTGWFIDGFTPQGGLNPSSPGYDSNSGRRGGYASYTTSYGGTKINIPSAGGDTKDTDDWRSSWNFGTGYQSDSCASAYLMIYLRSKQDIGLYKRNPNTLSGLTAEQINILTQRNPTPQIGYHTERRAPHFSVYDWGYLKNSINLLCNYSAIKPRYQPFGTNNSNGHVIYEGGAAPRMGIDQLVYVVSTSANTSSANGSAQYLYVSADASGNSWVVNHTDGRHNGITSWVHSAGSIDGDPSNSCFFRDESYIFGQDTIYADTLPSGSAIVMWQPGKGGVSHVNTGTGAGNKWKYQQSASTVDGATQKSTTASIKITPYTNIVDANVYVDGVKYGSGVSDCNFKVQLEHPVFSPSASYLRNTLGTDYYSSAIIPGSAVYASDFSYNTDKYVISNLSGGRIGVWVNPANAASGTTNEIPIRLTTKKYAFDVNTYVYNFDVVNGNVQYSTTPTDKINGAYPTHTSVVAGTTKTNVTDTYYTEIPYGSSYSITPQQITGYTTYIVVGNTNTNSYTGQTAKTSVSGTTNKTTYVDIIYVQQNQTVNANTIINGGLYNGTKYENGKDGFEYKLKVTFKNSDITDKIKITGGAYNGQYKNSSTNIIDWQGAVPYGAIISITPQTTDISKGYTANTITYTSNSTTAKELNPTWNPNTYNITYELNGGSVSKTNPTTAKYDEYFTVTNPIRKGFKFMGWTVTGCDTEVTHYYKNTSEGTFTGNTGSYTTVGTSTQFKNLNYVQGSTVKLTAIWQDNEAPDLDITITNKDNTPYTPGTWTGQDVTIKGTGDDETGITGTKIKPDSTITETTPSNPNSYTYDKTGTYNATVTTEDKAGTENTTTGKAWIKRPEGNYKTVIEKKLIMVDKTPPEAEVTYTPPTDTNGDVVVTVVASDEHSGLHDTPYSWDGGKTWTATKTKTVTYNTNGNVIVRDKVGNKTTVPWKITWIDKITPQVKSNISYAIGNVPKSNSGTYGNEAKTYTQTGVVSESTQNISLPWSNENVTLKWNVTDLANAYFFASGVKTSVLTETDKTFTTTKSTLINTTDASYEYTDEIEGERYFKLVVTDKVGNKTTITYTVRVDKSKISYNQAKSKVKMTDLSEYTSEQIEERINSGVGFPNRFEFFFYDDNLTDKLTVKSDDSGIESVELKLWDANNPSDYRDYTLTSNTSQITKTYSNTERIYSALYGVDIDTYKEFPEAYELKYSITVKDYAGNVADYGLTGVLTNYAIKAVIYSTEDDIFNVSTNGGLDNLAYFKTGDFGYVDVWTIGYAKSIGFDFKDVGEISATQIEDGILAPQYNLGVNSKVGYSRIIPNTVANGVKGAFPINSEGDTYGHHYIYKTNGWLDGGVLIRIPPSEDLLVDNVPDKPDNDEPEYVYETHKANIYAYRGTSNCYDECEYVLFGTSRDGIHYRVTHELQ